MRSKTMMYAAILVTVGAAGGVQAGEWKHTLAPYVWGAGMDGTSAVGPVEADVDVSFGDIWDNLKMGAMLAYRGEGDGPWIFMGEVIYMDLEVDNARDVGPVRINSELGAQQTLLEGDLGYRLNDKFFAYAGLRYTDLEMDVTVNTTGPGPGGTLAGNGGESWVDPVIGAVAELPLAERWTIALRGDVGGFGVGSDFAWQAIATVRWQASETIHVGGGYRYLDADYEDGEGASYFKYDIASAGPFLGVAFTF